MRHPHRRLLPPVHFGGPPGVPPPNLPVLTSPPPFPPVPTGVPMVGMPVPDMMKTCTVTTPTVITPTSSIQGAPSCGGMPFLPSAHPPPGVMNSCSSACTTLPNTSLLQPLSQPVNALAEDCLTTDLDGLSDSGTEVEAMDCVPCASGSIPANGSVAQKNGSSESLMQVEGCDSCDKADTIGAASAEFEGCETGKAGDGCEAASPLDRSPVTLDDVALLADLFYLPFEHGTRAVQFLHTLHWLIENLQSVQPSKKGTDEVWHALSFE